MILLSGNNSGSYVVIVVILIAAGIWGFVQYRDAQERKAAWAYYQWCLANLHHHPQARSQVVNAGRAWYGALRGGQVTVYDEMAIGNDIKQAGG